jgi:hypothetical protein
MTCGDQIPQDLKLKCYEVVLQLAAKQFEDKETKHCIIKFVKSVTHVLTEEEILPYMGQLVPLLLDSAALFRPKVKFVIKMLLGKIGYDRVSQYFPEKDRPLLDYVVKSARRKKKPKTFGHRRFTEDMDDDDRLKQRWTTIREQLPKEFHFLHPSEIPKQPKKRVAAELAEFKTTADDRLIIREDMDVEGSSKSKDRQKRPRGDDEPVMSKKRRTNEDGVVITQSAANW